MGNQPDLYFYNTLTRTRTAFAPVDADHVRMYVCGPTLYDRAHIGNARPVIVFDVLFRVLRHVFGESKVTYIRNLTDVDDKINARAVRDYPGMPLNDAIRKVTSKAVAQFMADMEALGSLSPSVQPRATDSIKEMIGIISRLIEGGHAYLLGGDVLFDINSMPAHGKLSNTPHEEQRLGARAAIDEQKKNHGDFVLWKLSDEKEPSWDSPWGRGRPGWHIECAAMSNRHLGETFDIHGGGSDLIFSHHENAIAQSHSARGTNVMANIWMHNGFLLLEGRKMSKSEGRIVTVHDLLHTDRFGGRKWSGEVVRLAMLMTHYRDPINFSIRGLEEAERALAMWPQVDPVPTAPEPSVLEALADDLNTPVAVRMLHALAKAGENELFAASAALLGLQPKRKAADGKVVIELEERIKSRTELLKAKKFSEADNIRDSLAAKGIDLIDGKDPSTGERTTTWEWR